MGKKKNNRIAVLLGYSVLILFVLGIGLYLYKNTNIAEKISYASFISSQQSQSLNSARRRSKYSFEAFEFAKGVGSIDDKGTGGNINVEAIGDLENRDRMLAGTALGVATLVWDDKGGVQGQFELKEEMSYSKVFGVNRLGQIGVVQAPMDLKKEAISYLFDLNNPAITLEPSKGYSLRGDYIKSDKQEYFETIVKQRGLSKDFPPLIFRDSEGKSLNNYGDVAGTQYVSEAISGGIVWLSSNQHEPIDLSETIASQLGIHEGPGQQIYNIDDKKNIWANARAKNKVVLGYFEYLEPNQWKLRQTWSHQDPSSTYTMLGASNGNYAVVQEYNIVDFIINESSFVYQNRKVPRLFSSKPFLYRYKIEDYLKDVVDGKLEVFTIKSINNRNEILALYATDKVIDSFIMNLDTKEIKLYSNLLKTGAIHLPDGYEFSPYAMSDDGSLYGSYRIGDSFYYYPGVLRKL